MVCVPLRKADLLLIDVRILFRGVIIESCMAVKDGLILKIGKEPELPPAEMRVNGRGKLVLPGAIDAHVHLRDQELSYKETFESGTAAAVAGGVTTVLDMPNNEPPTNTVRNLQERMKLAEGRIHCNVGFYGAPNRNPSETAGLLNEGVFGLKVNMLKPIGEQLRSSELRRSLKDVKKAHKVTVFHAENGVKVRKLKNSLKRSGKENYRDFLTAHPPITETSATHEALEHVKAVGGRGHIAHVSIRAALTEILSAKNAGISVTCEVTPHHLLLDAGRLNNLNGLGIMTPPLRTSEDCVELQRALAEGTIDACASDHAPHAWSEKASDSVWHVSPGVSGLDTFMPLLLTHIKSWGIDYPQLSKITSRRPADIFGISKRGSLERGHYADFIIIDTSARKRVRADDFKSKAKFSPFEGWPLTASLSSTYVRGECVLSDGEIVGKPTGSVLRSLGDGVKISPRWHAG